MDENKELEKAPVIGNFKPKRKFLSFVTAVSSAKVRLLRNYAYVDATKLSGMLEGVTLKLTICDEGTINIEEVDTNETNSEMLGRLIEEIDSLDVTGYSQKFVVSGLEFKDEDGIRCYLEVEHEKPIDKFASILDSLKDEDTLNKNLSEEGFSILDALFSSESQEELEREFEGENVIISEEDAEVFVENILNPPLPNENLNGIAKSYLEESFNKMNMDKINELSDRIGKTKKEISKNEYELKMSEKKIDELKSNLKVLESRYEQIHPVEDSNGYVFFISEEKKMDISLSDNDKELVSRISNLMGLKEQALFEHLTEGFYNIKIAKSGDIDNKDFVLPKEIMEKIVSIDGKISFKDEEIEYRGELNWHQLVQKMIRMGFEQDPEFDKLCNSNSYESKWTSNSETPNDCALDIEKEENVTNSDESEFNSEEFLNIENPTDIVFIGTGHCEVEDFNLLDTLRIDDDYTELDIYINGEKTNKSYESDGFFTVMKLSDYKNWYKYFLDNYGDSDSISGFLLTSFKGYIKVGAVEPKIDLSGKIERYTYIKNIDFSDYIHHKYNSVNAFLDLPEGVSIFDLNKDLSLPTSIIRDVKIESIIK